MSHDDASTAFTAIGHYIDGAWRRTAAGERMVVVDPATGQTLGDFPAATPADLQ